MHSDGRFAFEHYSDGSTLKADEYRPGASGMVEADWKHGAVLELEVPNAKLKGGVTQRLSGKSRLVRSALVVLTMVLK